MSHFIQISIKIINAITEWKKLIALCIVEHQQIKMKIYFQIKIRRIFDILFNILKDKHTIFIFTVLLHTYIFILQIYCI